MKRVTIELVTVTALILSALSAHAATAAERSTDNVVIIHVDDLGWRDLACMGSPVYETPHIDALAKSGTLYTNAYAAGSLCTPSRACMLTGSQPSRHGVYTVVKNRGEKKQWKVIPEKNNQFLPKDYPTIGTVLTEAGIANGAVGKWHIAGAVPSNGFQEGTLGGYLGMPINYFAPFKLPFLPKDVPDGTYLPPLVREAGVEFLERHQKERFFLYFSTYLPHDEIKNEDGATLDAPKDVVAKYERKIAAMKKAGKDLQGHENPVYAAMIEETDRSVGAIIDKLDELGLRKKTLVLFISDNGGLDKYTSQRPLRGDKCTLYEGGIRVPMIASMPGRVGEGKASDEPVSGIDFYPTICSFMGLKPTDPDKVDGEDLSDLIFAGKSLGERNLFWNFPSYNRPEDPARCPRSVLRRGDWKIHHRYEDKGYELYNLKEDIGESKDLSESRPEILKMMRRELEASYERFGAVKTLEPNPEYVADEAGKHLFILSGQSNMVGMDPKVSFTPAVTKAFGKDGVIVVKDAHGGQSIRSWCKSNHEFPPPTTGRVPKVRGELYDRLIQKVKAATEGQALASVTFVWMQGESDLNNTAYDAYLKELLQQLQTDLAFAEINVVIGRISDAGLDNPKRLEGRLNIRRVQQQFAEAHPRGVWVDTDDLNDRREGDALINDLHYTKEGYRVLGSRFAEKAIALVEAGVEKPGEAGAPRPGK